MFLGRKVRKTFEGTSDKTLDFFGGQGQWAARILFSIRPNNALKRYWVKGENEKRYYLQCTWLAATELGGG